MNFGELIVLLKQALMVVLIVITPILVISLVIGLMISIFQAVTSIQEMTLTFVPKILISFISLIILGQWMAKVVVSFTEMLIKNIPYIIR